jgi:hypothetical protein
MSSQKISRRSFLKAASMAGIGAGLMRGLPSFASAAFQDKIDMSLWECGHQHFDAATGYLLRDLAVHDRRSRR